MTQEEQQTIALPAKTLVVLCGAAGSGKSTFAAQHFTPTQIVSSDFCRALISDSYSNFRINSDTFDLFHTIIQKRLKLGRRTCADRGLPMVGTARPVHAKPWQHGGRMAKQFDN